MMPKVKLCILVTFAVCLASPALAGVGWFTGVVVGESEFGDYELQAQSDSIDDGDTSFFAYGGYQINKYFSVGAGYADLGELNASGAAFGGFTDRLEATGFSAFTMGTLPLGKKISVFAMTGTFSWDQDVTYQDSFGPFVGNSSGTDLMYGAGVIWDILGDRGLHVHAAWNTFENVGDLAVTGHENDITLVSVGASYLFGR